MPGQLASSSCSSLVLVFPRPKDCLMLLAMSPDLISLPASASQHSYHPAPGSCQYSYQCYLHNPWSTAGRIIPADGCEGLDPADISCHLPPGWAAGLCRLPRAVGRGCDRTHNRATLSGFRADQIGNRSAPKYLFCREGDGNNTYL